MATGRIQGTWTAAKRVSGVFLQSLDALLYYLAMDFPAHDYLKRERPPRKAENEPRDWVGA
jgi:hypothetical protein